MTSSGVTQYSVSASAARSPARPWIHTAPAAAITGPAGAVWTHGRAGDLAAEALTE